MNKRKLGEFSKNKRSSPKKIEEPDKRTSTKRAVGNNFTVYWIRILEILESQKRIFMLGDKYDVPLPDKKYYKHEGFNQDKLNQELGKRVTNSSLETRDYDELLGIMQDPKIPYINKYEDPDGKTRYRLTLLGELALKRKREDDVMKGYWEIVDKTQQPKEKVEMEDILKRRKA